LVHVWTLVAMTERDLAQARPAGGSTWHPGALPGYIITGYTIEKHS
jgi:hypothetical protein